uniref:Beta-glucosidase n=1 Tax=Timema bartmani TaxID=61472 RepID=A0A7R9ESW4_9NEOP|nr:unnamed protein product [Timema bartmani]
MFLQEGCAAQDEVLSFPDEFLFGAASAAYQVEGAWDQDGKGENIWDRLVHTHPEMIADGQSGDVATDAYHKYTEDIKALLELGVDFYRFSISWSRILPNGNISVINQPGIDYYNNIINALLANNIQPVSASLEPILWDGEQEVERHGLASQPSKVSFRANKNRWIMETVMALATRQILRKNYTFGNISFLENERNFYVTIYHWDLPQPLQDLGGWPNSVMVDFFEDYARILFKNFGDRVKWWITFNEPYETTTGYSASTGVDAPAIDLSGIGDYLAAHTILKAHATAYHVYDTEFRAQQNGTYDFYGMNHYSTNLVSLDPSASNVANPPSLWHDQGVNKEFDSSWTGSAASWLKIVPWGIRKQLNWIKDQYGNPPLLITENGYADYGDLSDTNRIIYYAKLRDARVASQWKGEVWREPLADQHIRF